MFPTETYSIQIPSLPTIELFKKQIFFKKICIKYAKILTPFRFDINIVLQDYKI